MPCARCHSVVKNSISIFRVSNDIAISLARSLSHSLSHDQVPAVGLPSLRSSFFFGFNPMNGGAGKKLGNICLKSSSVLCKISRTKFNRYSLINFRPATWNADTHFSVCLCVCIVGNLLCYSHRTTGTIGLMHRKCMSQILNMCPHMFSVRHSVCMCVCACYCADSADRHRPNTRRACQQSSTRRPPLTQLPLLPQPHPCTANFMFGAAAIVIIVVVDVVDVVAVVQFRSHLIITTVHRQTKQGTHVHTGVCPCTTRDVCVRDV